MASEQQWTPVVLRKEMKTKPKSELALHQAKAKGQVEVQHKAASSSTVMAAHKLDNAEAGDYKQPTVSLELYVGSQTKK